MGASSPPSEPAARKADPPNPARPVFRFACAVLGASALGVYETLVRQPTLYLPGESFRRVAIVSISLLVGAAVAFRLRSRDGDPRRRLVVSLVAASVALAGSGWLHFYGFVAGGWVHVTVFVAPVTATVATMTMLGYFWAALARPAFALGVAARLTNPFVVLLAMACIGVVAFAVERIGTLRSSLVAAMVLAACAAWAPDLFRYLEGLRLPGDRRLLSGSVLAFAGHAAALVAAEAALPMRVLSAYANDVVYAKATDRRLFVVASGQEAFELFVDGELRVSDTDAPRYYEALVHPAAAVATNPRTAAVLDGGTGLAERELLRVPTVTSIVSVVQDRALVELARHVSWLDARADHAMWSDAIRVVEREPIVWLQATEELFDIVVVDVADPDGYVAGKYYTKHFYELVRQRLAPEGVAVVQATSALAAPRTFASIVSTIQGAGLTTLPYRAAVPTYGEWSFVLAAKRELGPPTALPAELDYLNQNNARHLFDLPNDVVAAADQHVSTLFDQRTVRIFEQEVRARD